MYIFISLKGCLGVLPVQFYIFLCEQLFASLPEQNTRRKGFLFYFYNISVCVLNVSDYKDKTYF